MSTIKSGTTRGPGVMDPHGLHKLGHRLWFAPVHAALVRALQAQPGQRILDVGAGAGALAERISGTGATVVCVEPDAGSLAAARQRLAGRSAEFVAAAAEDIPLPDSSADGAVVSLSAHHWADRDQGFGEIARIVRPGGRLVIAEFRPAGPVRALLRRLGGSKHAAAPGTAAWTASLARSGFADARAVPSGWASVLVLIISARREARRDR
jgi:ubiquinone/menaquinone biosynthesis C-methylase UbiE